MSGRVSHHHYTVRDVLSHVRMVLEGSVAMRAAARVTDILSDVVKLPLGTPQWSTIRLWLMRLGHYKLTRPKERANDWVWLIDHSVQIGPRKCLMILGIRLSRLPAAGECLRYEDLEPIELLPVETSNKQIVREHLKRPRPRRVCRERFSTTTERICPARPVCGRNHRLFLDRTRNLRAARRF